MSTYAIGDIQGCYDSLQKLLEHIQFDDNIDTLWFCGDLVNRGPKSLAVIRFVKSLGKKAITVLGNHDLHLLTLSLENFIELKDSDTVKDILTAPDREEILLWLRQQPLLYHDEKLNFVLVHAGIYPQWNLAQAKNFAVEIETVLQNQNYIDFLKHMYGNEPNTWNNSLSGYERLRFITNAFTRMRYCDLSGKLDFSEKGDLINKPKDFLPWFLHPNRKTLNEKIIFGHWASLYNQWQTVINLPNLYALDSGCIWGNSLTALRLEDAKRFEVTCNR